jgi:uroporphyrinogen decarboxylase
VTPLLGEAIGLQLRAGADVVMMLDTAAGELPPAYFHAEIAHDIAGLARRFPRQVGYYAKASHPAMFRPPLTDAPWAGFGFDSRWDLAEALSSRPAPGFVQGNFDPAWLCLSPADLDRALEVFLDPLAQLPEAARRGWICGLGHGVLPGTPERAVHTFVRTVREKLA